MNEQTKVKHLHFYGASDDLLECEGAIREEIGCYNSPGIYHLKSAEGEIQVVGYYLDSGLWSIGISQVAEDTLLPAWPVSTPCMSVVIVSSSPSQCRTTPFWFCQRKMNEHYPA